MFQRLPFRIFVPANEPLARRTNSLSTSTHMKIIGITRNFQPQPRNMAQPTTLYNHETAHMPDGPVIYYKPDSTLLTHGKPFFIPEWTRRCTVSLHVVVRISRMGRHIAPRFAYRYYDALGVGLDFTDEALLTELTAAGNPTDAARGFDGSAAIGGWIEGADLTPDIRQHAPFRLELNGQTVQQGNTADWIWNTDEAIARISRLCTLRQGDLLFMGCPAAPITVNQDMHAEGFMAGKRLLAMNIK